jgi:hypothetical protein
MSQEKRAPRAPDGQEFEMKPGRPPTFGAEQILFRDLVGTTQHAVYQNIRAPMVFRGEEHFEALVKYLADGGRFRTGRDNAENFPLDLPVYRECYIVLRYSRASGLTFPAGKPGITLATDSASDHICGAVRYVNPNLGISMTCETGCRLAFFSTLYRPGLNGRIFKLAVNFHVADDKGRSGVIDPDIRHPGNGGQNAEEEGG